MILGELLAEWKSFLKVVRTLRMNIIGVHNEGEKTSPAPYLVIQINCAPIGKILSTTLLRLFNWILKLNINNNSQRDRTWHDTTIVELNSKHIELKHLFRSPIKVQSKVFEFAYFLIFDFIRKEGTRFKLKLFVEKGFYFFSDWFPFVWVAVERQTC